MENNHIFYNVGEDRRGQRLDNALMALNRSLPKGLIYRSIRKGRVRVNGMKAKQDYRLQADDLIKYPAWSLDPKPDSVDLNPDLLVKVRRSIIYQDKDVIVVNKPKGLVCQKGSKSPVCLQDYLSELYPECKWHLTHRLDKDTSGVLIVAKNVPSARWVAKQFLLGTVNKRYWALMDGVWIKKGWKRVSLPILKRSNQAYAVVSDQGKEAISHFRLMKASGEFSFMEVKIDTGRTHQIRVHASEIGYPLLGDSRYNSKSPKGCYLLHSRSLEIILPNKSNYTEFVAPLEQGQVKVLSNLNIVI
jgi:23S rRNA pseudouridine955/2504/2580 synthase